MNAAASSYDTSTRREAAEQHYDAALTAFQTYLGDPVAHIEQALAAEPDFVMGHLLRATALVLTSERRFVKQAQASLEVAQSLVGRANPRERGITQAVRALVAGDWDAACRRFDQVLAEHPTDVFSLQAAHLLDFLRGDALNLRNRVARVLPRWSAAEPGYSFVLGLYAFGLEECNQYAEAEDAGRRALDMDPRDAWAVHAVTHVMEMQGRVAEGIEWLERRRDDWAPSSAPGNALAFHNWWHLGLFHLDRGEPERALAILDEHIVPGVGDLSMGLLDVTSMLWRLRLLGVETGNRFRELAQHWREKVPAENGYYPFNDFHAALTFAACGERDLLASVKEGLTRATREGAPSSQHMAAVVGLPLVAAVEDYAAGRFSLAMERLVSVRDVARRFGGSHAQRDLVTLLLIDAARQAGERTTARHYVNERLAAKPSSGLGWRLLAGVL